MFKNVEKTTTTGTKFFYPCVVMGKAVKSVVFPPNFYWDQISWKICSEKEGENKVELLIFFHHNENVDGRAICTLDTTAGKVSEFRYQDAKTFAPEEFDDINSMKILKGKSNDAFRYTISLVHYFGRVNKAEYEKKPLLKTAAFRKNMVGRTTHITPTESRESSYNPDHEKITYINDTKGTKKPRCYTVDYWQKSGHFRHCKSGKIVYIKPTICRPKK